MKIGIISDTHMFKKAKILPKALVEGLSEVELIIHAGDWSELAVKDMLEEIAPVIGVHGNIDSEEIINKLQDKIVLLLDKYKIGVVHGHLGKKSLKTPDKAFEAFLNESVDCIIFGHSHIPYKDYREGILLYNPGSPTDKRFQKEFSYGLMTISEQLHIEHHTFQNKI